MKRIALFGSVISMIIFIFIIIIGETFEFDFITSSLMISIGVLFLLLFIVFLCILWNISTKNEIGKILPTFFFCVFLMSTFFMLDHIFNLYKDKESYEKKDFAIVEGTPNEVSFSRQNYLNHLKVDGVELDVTMLDMTKVYFEQKYLDKEIIVKYLPETKLVVKIKSVEQ